VRWLVAVVFTLGCGRVIVDGGSGGEATGSTGGTNGTVGPSGTSGGNTSSGNAESGTEASCGNGQLDPGEACDDGNTVDGDGCSGDCSQIEQVEWCKTFGEDGQPEAGSALAVSQDGTIAVAGWGREPTDMWLSTHDMDGNLVWAVYEGTEEYEDEGLDLAFDSGGNIIVVGRTGAEHDSDALVVKFGPDGGPSWAHTHASPEGSDVVACGVAVDVDDSIVVVGDIDPLEGANDLLLRRYDPSGDQVWTASFVSEDPCRHEHSTLVIEESGEILVGTQCTYPALVRFEADGTQLGTTPLEKYSLGTIGAGMRAMAFGEDGLIAIGSAVFGHPTTGDETAAVELHDAAGRLWDVWLPHPDYRSSFVDGIAITTVGNVLAVGENDGMWAVAWAEDGTRLWEHVGPAGSSGRFADVALGPGGEAFVTGRALITEPGDADTWQLILCRLRL